jgi:hypothetical protein
MKHKKDTSYEVCKLVYDHIMNICKLVVVLCNVLSCCCPSFDIKMRSYDTFVAESLPIKRKSQSA